MGQTTLIDRARNIHEALIKKPRATGELRFANSTVLLALLLLFDKTRAFRDTAMSPFISVVCLLVALSQVGQLQGGATWEYTGSLGPDQWYTEYEHCRGRMQSPINIETGRVLFDRSLQSFDTRQYASLEGVNMTLKNVGGHTVEVVYSGSPIEIQGGSLPDDYVLDQFHFHWGASDERGSEHLMDNQAAPMELHIVHHMKSLAPSTSSSQPYGLAVLGFLFQIGGHNTNFDTLLSNFPDVVHKDTHKTIQPFALADLLGERTSGNYYRYYGSLTTPPCYETVIWTLFQDRITISQEQLNTFRSLRNLREGETVEVSISDDFRPTQPLHERRVTSNDITLVSDRVSDMIEELSRKVNAMEERCTSGAARVAWGGMGMRMGLMVMGWGLLVGVMVWRLTA